MYMIRQNNPAMNFEGMTLLNQTNIFSQHVNVANKKIILFPLEQINGKKASSSRIPFASIVRHYINMVWNYIRRNTASPIDALQIAPYRVLSGDADIEISVSRTFTLSPMIFCI